jgi:hypothetical protein
MLAAQLELEIRGLMALLLPLLKWPPLAVLMGRRLTKQARLVALAALHRPV